MRIREIFLDLDDVLNRCTMEALRYVGCPVSAYDDSAYNPAWGWDIVAAANVLHPHDTFTAETFWKTIKRDFWANAPKSAECDGLILTCGGIVGPENVCILSSPTLDPDCLAGKLEWIQRVLPPWIHRQFLIGPCKHFCAKPGSLLIDDRDRNVRDFRQAGGQAILMPRPWNSAHAEDPADCVRLLQALQETGYKLESCYEKLLGASA